MKIEIGNENSAFVRVDENNTALAAKSGSLPVFATPYMTALMEQAASELCDKFADENETTVGTALSIEHLAASPVGADITAKAVVTAVEGRKISFIIEAYDNAGLIGKGTHERFVVYKDRFVEKAQSRIEK